MSALECYIDSAAPRILLDRQALLCDGRGWDLIDSDENVVIDMATYTAMLRPSPLNPLWQTSASGAYARWRKSDFTLITAAKWGESAFRFSTDFYLESLDVNEIVYTPALLRNQGVYLSYFNFQTGNELFISMECGFGAPGAGRSFRIWSDGNAEVWVDDVLVGNLRLSGEPDDYPSRLGPLGTGQGAKGRAVPALCIDLLFLPCRLREILIISNQGGPANHQYEDIDPTDADPTVTEAAPFWFYVPSGKAKVQVAPLRFATAGVLLQPTQALRYPPPAGTAIAYDGGADLPGYGAASATMSLVDDDGTTPFDPDGSRAAARLRVDLAGDGTNTPFVYWASAELAPTIVSTPSEPTSLLPYLLARQAPRLEVPESPADVLLSLTVKQPYQIEADGATFLRTVGNRPIEVGYGGIAILTGTTKSPTWTEGISDEARAMVIEVRDRWKHLESYLLQDPLPLDGMRLDDAVAYFATLPGFDVSETDIDPIDFFVPSVPGASRGEYANLPEVGDKPSDWLRRLWETYAMTHIMGWVPSASGPLFRFRSPASLGTTPVATLYSNLADAAGDVRGVYRTYREINLEPEANSVFVTGRDPRTLLPLIAHYIDLDSVDPTLAVAARPANWLGEERRYGLVDTGITTINGAIYSAGVIASRLVPGRRTAEWTCDLIARLDGAPAWRGDCVRLNGFGVYRITSLSAVLQLESPLGQWRPTSYTGEWQNV